MTIGIVVLSYPEYNSTDSYRMEQYTVCVSHNNIDIHTFRLLIPVLLCRDDETTITNIIFVLFAWD